MSHHDPVPSFTRAVLDLFRGPLAKVKFPDVDAELLAVHEREVIEAQRALEAAELAASIARDHLAACTAGLAGKAQRALAYARVFAEDDRDLRERIHAISGEPSHEPRVAMTNTTRKPRRARTKTDDEAATLFEQGSEAAPEEATQLSA